MAVVFSCGNMFNAARQAHLDRQASSAPRRVIVIGAGTTGICAAKVAREHGLDVVVYEQSDRIGGNWNYTDRVGPDEYGLQTGFMYQGVLTNVPKETMRYLELDVPIEDHSFMTQEEVLEFLHYYAKTFNVEEMVKFRHEVVRVQPRRDGRWEVIVRDVIRNEYKTEYFDYVMVCSGHYWKPRHPKIKGEELFKGSLKHSYDFRKKEEYTGQKVCIVGSGSSGIDIAMLLTEVCPEVIYSQNYPYTEDAVFPENLTLIGDVQEITETGVLLKDGNQHSADAILYCTGFDYAFPFLTADSGIIVEDNCVGPLYKQLININHPTMAFIGLNFHVCFHMVVELQARTCMAFWTTDRTFPGREEMLADSQRDLEVRLAKGWKKRHAHRIWDLHEEYSGDLAKMAGVPGIPPVYLKIFFDAMGNLRKDYGTYRKANYHVLDSENYVKVMPENND